MSRITVVTIYCLVKKRLLVYCVTFFVLWPLMSLMASAISADKVKWIVVPIGVAFLAASGGTIIIMPDFIVVIIGIIIVVFSVAYATSGSRLKVSLSIFMAGILLVSFSEGCRSYHGMKKPLDQSGVIILLGIDSVSYSDDLSIILNWAKSNSGTPYELAVTPGLLTNSVWTSLITMKPVSEHGVFHAFQSGYPKDGDTILDRARSLGYRTVLVEFTISKPNEWQKLIKSVKLNWDGGGT